MKLRIEKFLSSKLYISIVAIFMILLWLASYASKIGKIDSSYMLLIETFGLTFIGIAVLLILVNFSNLGYAIIWILFTPFIFAHPFDTTNIPYALYIACYLLAAGIIVNIIRFKPTFKIGSFFIGFACLGIALILGGINTGAEFLKKQLLFSIPVVIAFLFLYNYLANGIKTDFKYLCYMLVWLGIMFVFEVAFFFVFSNDPIVAIETKNLEVGWGVSNNIALLMLFTFPCCFYLAFKGKGLQTIVYLLIAFLQVVAIIITYSRGAIIACLLGLIIITIYGFFKAFKNCKGSFIPYTITIGCLFLASATCFWLFLSGDSEFAQNFRENVTKIDWNTMNGRKEIYQHYIDSFKENMIFGKGMFSPYTDNEFTGSYQWGHSTIIHTLYTMGLVGGVSLLIHMVQKYWVLLRKCNPEKMTAIFALAISGLYGLFDVSYYFISYMVILVVFLAAIEGIVKKKSNKE